MQMWFSQYHTVNVKLDVRIQEQLFSGQSDYQKIDVFKSYEFGKMVALDGEIVFSDTDEFIYDEMVTHIPMAVHPDVKNVLIILISCIYFHMALPQLSVYTRTFNLLTLLSSVPCIEQPFSLTYRIYCIISSVIISPGANIGIPGG